jgi:glycosyltransferase involved in cell wall biosynthesis
LKILHYVDENNLTWARPWLQLIKYLEDKGLQNHILCRPGGSLDKHVIENNIGLSTYKPLISSLPQLCPGVSAIIKEIRPDIIHTRLSSAAMIGGYWGKRMGVPVVSTIDKYPKKKYYLNSDKLIPCSSAIADHMKKQGFFDSDMQVIFNPVSESEYDRDVQQRKKIRDANGIQETDFVILGAGRLVDWKGFDTLLKACLILESRSASAQNWKVWLAGDGPERQKLELFVESSPEMRSRVKFWGFVDDIRPLMWASDLFVIPSHNEPFGLVLLEAMACGLPVVATSIGGPLDIVSKDSGWFFDPGDTQRLAIILDSILNNRDLQHFSIAAQLRAQSFSVEKIGEQTLRFYETVIRDKQNIS